MYDGITSTLPVMHRAYVAFFCVGPAVFSMAWLLASVVYLTIIHERALDMR